MGSDPPETEMVSASSAEDKEARRRWDLTQRSCQRFDHEFLKITFVWILRTAQEQFIVYRVRDSWNSDFSSLVTHSWWEYS